MATDGLVGRTVVVSVTAGSGPTSARRAVLVAVDSAVASRAFPDGSVRFRRNKASLDDATKQITVNGTVKLKTELGNDIVHASSLRIHNPHATIIAYVHLMPTGSGAPAAGTEGWPIGGAAGAASKTFESDEGSIDLNRVYIHTPS